MPLARFSQAQAFDEASITSLTFAVSSGTNANRVIVVGVGSNSLTGQAVSYQGTDMGAAKASSGSRNQIFSLNDPTTGSNDVVFSQTNATFMWGSAATYQDAGTTSATATTSAGSGDTDISVSITTNNNNSMIFDFAVANAANVTLNDSSQTLIQKQEIPTNDFATGSSQFLQVTAGARTMTWAASVNTDFDRISAIEVTEDVAAAANHWLLMGV